MITITGVGDIMPGGLLNGETEPFVEPDVLEFLRASDIRVGNLETAIGDDPSFFDEKMKRSADVIYAKDDDLKRLKLLDINVVSLANNHFFDLGPLGAEHTISMLDSLNILHCGAGLNIEEASKPVVIEKDGKKIAFLAFCDWRQETVGWCPFATKTEPGVNPMTDDYVVSEIKKYKKQYNYVVVIPHWGKEHSFVTTSHVYRLANKMVVAGADVVLGSHTHRVQPVVRKRGKVIAYSMGNFLFPDRLIVKPRSTYYPDKVIDVKDLPVTYGYPYVDALTLKLWKPLARVGLAVQVCIGEEKISHSSNYVRINSLNRLSSYNAPLKIRIPMMWQWFCLCCTPYPAYEFVFSKTKRMAKWIKKRSGSF